MSSSASSTKQQQQQQQQIAPINEKSESQMLQRFTYDHKEKPKLSNDEMYDVRKIAEHTESMGDYMLEFVEEAVCDCTAEVETALKNLTMPEVVFHIPDPTNTYVPQRWSNENAGYDLWIYGGYTHEKHIVEEEDDEGTLTGRRQLDIPPCSHVMVPTGVHMKISKGFYGKIEMRSGLAKKHGILVGGGIVDSNYRGDVHIILINPTKENVLLYLDEAVAQIIFLPCHIKKRAIQLLDRNAWNAMLKEEKEENDRMDKGFGSSTRTHAPILASQWLQQKRRDSIDFSQQSDDDEEGAVKEPDAKKSRTEAAPAAPVAAAAPAATTNDNMTMSQDY
jgi:deoxyuridine 5'-triphosphate nucleotidohydrolase